MNPDGQLVGGDAQLGNVGAYGEFGQQKHFSSLRLPPYFVKIDRYSDRKMYEIVTVLVVFRLFSFGSLGFAQANKGDKLFLNLENSPEPETQIW